MFCVLLLLLPIFRKEMANRKRIVSGTRLGHFVGRVRYVRFIGDPGGTTHVLTNRKFLYIDAQSSFTAVTVHAGTDRGRWYTDCHKDYDYGRYCPDSVVFLIIVIFVNYLSVLRRCAIVYNPVFFPRSPHHRSSSPPPRGRYHGRYSRFSLGMFKTPTLSVHKKSCS